jgi:heme-degrading monooxygenase HmoA
MSVLIVELHVRAGDESELERVFASAFRPAISAQPGFQEVMLMRPGQGPRWLLEIRFVDEDSRLAWVATDLHQSVWPQIDVLCDRAVPEVFEPVD